MPDMAVPAPAKIELQNCTVLLDAIERGMHSVRSEWIFLRELRVGTGRRQGNLQRLDAFALNTLLHTGMKRVCYEAKVSRADFLLELKHPLKRRMGMRYSNEFYFVTPPGLLTVAEIPAECGLIEAGITTTSQWKHLVNGHAGFFAFDPESGTFCVLRVPAPWRDTPGPTWQLAAAMLRHQRREMEERPPAPPMQQKLQLL
ncbi:MAG: hypothetical protein JO022_02320 [Acidobacteriaceae bacterium]|nr:hypothetical protein [Acidobacteriaceae bacterium]